MECKFSNSVQLEKFTLVSLVHLANVPLEMLFDYRVMKTGEIFTMSKCIISNVLDLGKLCSPVHP